MNNSAKKDNLSIENIINSYGSGIKNLILSCTGVRYIQDIQQEVYIKIWKNLPKYNNDGKLGGWIRRITVNTCKDHLKSRYYNEDNKTNEENDSIISISDKKLTPDNQILATERQKRIINAIEALKPKFREIIVLYDIEGLSYEEISGKLKCPVGTVKSRLFNARKQLQQELADLLY